MDILASLGIEIAKALLPVLVASLVGLALAWGKAQLAKARQYDPDTFDQLTYIAENAVHAAEQAGLSGLVKDKKAYALNIAEKWLATKNINIDLHLIDAAIEAAVWQEINKDADKTAKPAIGFVTERPEIFPGTVK